MSAEPARVGLVIVSHSAKIADGVVELAAQMAPATVIVAAGGTDDGRIGTSFDLISSAVGRADGGAGAVILCDLGSAILTAETAVEFLDDDVRERVRIADAPLVEGSVAAAVAAESGEPLAAVLAAAESANRTIEAAEAAAVTTAAAAGGQYTRSLELVNKDGLHARPAADLAKLAATFEPIVTVNGTNAKSVLGIMALGLTRGAAVELSGPDTPAGRTAVDELAALVESGFGEA
ncbi:MAG: dihydroxyacetone kinase phosphoryl donor subunit DhaM [Leifsonia sp.]